MFGFFLAAIMAAQAVFNSAPAPVDCATWYEQTEGHGPTVNGISQLWFCDNLPGGGYVISWPGIH